MGISFGTPTPIACFLNPTLLQRSGFHQDVPNHKSRRLAACSGLPLSHSFIKNTTHSTMKNKAITLGTGIGVAIGTLLGVAVGTAIGITALGLLGVDLDNQITFWISTGMAVGGGIGLVNFMLKSSGEE
jgi:hypothetical protein